MGLDLSLMPDWQNDAACAICLGSVIALFFFLYLRKKDGTSRQAVWKIPMLGRNNKRIKIFS